MTATLGADSEVGRLRTVMLHRPGPELKRLTPRNNDSLLFDGIPWVGRAQDEHDAFAQALRDRGVEVLYLVELLTQALASSEAREQAVGQVTTSLRLGDTMRGLPADMAARSRARGPRDRTHRGSAQRRGTRRLRTRHKPAGTRRFPRRPAAQPVVHPRLVGVAARPGGGHQPGDAGALARDAADRADLPVPSSLRRDAARARLAGRASRGRRRLADGAWRDRDRGRRAYDACRGRTLRPLRLRQRPGSHRPGRADRAGTSHHAPRHRLHDGRCRRDRDVSRMSPTAWLRMP